MPLPPSLLTHTCDIHRPFGVPTPAVTGLACRLKPDLAAGIARRTDAGLIWTHILDVQPGVDIRDGCSRAAGADAISYADGDQIFVPGGGSGASYVVVWVETVGLGTPLEHQRAYLLRHAA